MRNKNNQTEKNLSLQVNPRIICNLLICREGVLQREAGRQVGGRRRGGRRQGALHQGLRGLRRLHRVRQQCGRHQRDGRLLQRVRQVRGHNGERQKLLKKTFRFLIFQISPFSFFRFIHSLFSDLFTFIFQICKKATVAFLDAKISGASKVLSNRIFNEQIFQTCLLQGSL